MCGCLVQAPDQVSVVLKEAPQLYDGGSGGAVRYREVLDHLVQGTHTPADAGEAARADAAAADDATQNWREEMAGCCAALEDAQGQLMSALERDGRALLDESRGLAVQAQEFRQQCRRETGEAFSMVLETRRMLEMVTEDKLKAEQECATLRQALARVHDRSAADAKARCDAGGLVR